MPLSLHLWEQLFRLWLHPKINPDFPVSDHVICIKKHTAVLEEVQLVLFVAHSNSSALVYSVSNRNLRNDVVV